jgi:hypothetical protein
MASAEGQSGNLTDEDLQSEIELVGDLVVAATSSDGPMRQEEIDRLLGVRPPGDKPKPKPRLKAKAKAKAEPGAEPAL